ncbi:hypothetical protein M408DRAFT_26810 [Serendipita vermifera MAFF 305830]|uniref:Glycoside hydrolase family 105 protein n=1 Tax=Serendipita vermifera MAFF 305830 TaxID=933852 RepID=A0A0C2WE25_SERVB|nr:hypothetical protein M408DRAFT_26810 [Serendipita vermifera MAFF 305830]
MTSITRLYSLLALYLGTYAAAQTLTDAQVQTVRQRMADVARQSWELGTRAQVLIEYDSKDYDVLSSDASIPPNTRAPSSLNTPLSIARSVVQSKPQSQLTLVDDGSAADPAALGVVVLIANWTGQRDADYGTAASQQLEYLLNRAPRTSTGAISHRNDKVQLWSDSIYMVPPFLAYYGALHDNTTLMDEAYTQISLYRDELHDSDANNLWKHIAQGGSGEDPGHWATGNGWAAMGMLRVMGTYRASSKAGDYQDKQNTLVSWVEEIVEGMYSHTRDDSNALFRNYPDQSSSFYDASSTALMAAVTYRLAILTEGGSVKHIPDAERARKALCKDAGDPGSHIVDGWLSPVVDPHNFPVQGSQSPEGQAFVVSMIAAYKAWNEIGQPGVNAASRTVGGGLTILALCTAIISWIIII